MSNVLFDCGHFKAPYNIINLNLDIKQTKTSAAVNQTSLKPKEVYYFWIWKNNCRMIGGGTLDGFFLHM